MGIIIQSNVDLQESKVIRQRVQIHITINLVRELYVTFFKRMFVFVLFGTSRKLRDPS